MRIAVVVLLCGLAWGQADGPKDSFDAATVRLAAPDTADPTSLRGGPGTSDPGRISYTNASFRTLMGSAYDVQIDQISGPAWIATEYYDIIATLPAGTTNQQFRKMLQSLLVERFGLALHRERKEFVVYELGLAKGGSKLKAGPESRQGKLPADGRGMPVDSSGFPIPPIHQTAQRAENGVALFAANQVTMEAFARFLGLPMRFADGTPVGRVVDKTGLDGEYSFTLRYQWPSPAPAAAEAGGPNILDAVQQQLGLRLSETKAVLDLLVVDRAEKLPSAD